MMLKAGLRRQFACGTSSGSRKLRVEAAPGGYSFSSSESSRGAPRTGGPDGERRQGAPPQRGGRDSGGGSGYRGGSSSGEGQRGSSGYTRRQEQPPASSGEGRFGGRTGGRGTSSSPPSEAPAYSGGRQQQSEDADREGYGASSSGARAPSSSSSFRERRPSEAEEPRTRRGRDSSAQSDSDYDNREEEEGDGEGQQDGDAYGMPRSQRGGRRERQEPRPRYTGGAGGGGGGGGGLDGYGEKPFYETPNTTLRDNLRGEALYGVFPVLAALRTKRRELHELFIQGSMDMDKRKDGAAVDEVLTLAKQMDIPLQYVGRHELNLLSRDRPHQGLILDAGPLEWDRLDELPSAREAARDAAAAGRPLPVWLALDEVVDPQNLGALLRSAHCLGAAGVLGCSKNSAPLSAVVSKASSGALEVMAVHSCRNMPRTLEAAAASGWAVMGAAADSNSVGVTTVAVTQPTILVVGSEGFGLRTNVRRACSVLVKVEMGLPSRSERVVDSLNVSVATGILLHSLVESARQRGGSDDSFASSAADGTNFADSA